MKEELLRITMWKKFSIVRNILIRNHCSTQCREGSMIDVRSISKIYHMGKRKLTALKEVSFQIAEGEVLGLVGESGCGKSTLAKLIVRLEKPTSGQIFFGGRDISHAPR